MLLSSMRFKSFVWPHNPRTYTIVFQRKMAVHKLPFSTYHLQSLGRTRRVLRGEGEFVGEGAYDTFRQLADLFYEDTPGVLIHPVWMTTNAWFVGLEVLQQPRPDYVRYSFEFWEAEGDGLQLTLQSAPLPAGEGEEEGGQPGQPGQSAASAAQAAGQQVWHTVVQGDTIWALAAAYGSTPEAVVALNPALRNPNLIYPGEKVRVQ